MEKPVERARWVALLAKLEDLGTAVAAVEAAYRTAGGPSRATALLHGIAASLRGELGPFVERQLGAEGDADEVTETRAGS